jgi:hypothetical protein
MAQGRRISRAAFVDAWNNPDLTTDDIAAMFGVYRTSVSRMGQTRGLPPRKTGAKPRITREPFASLWLAGASTLDIARHLGVSRNYTGVLARRFGLQGRPHGARTVISMDDCRALQLREAMAASARETLGHMACAEMLDDRRAVMRRVAA